MSLVEVRLKELPTQAAKEKQILVTALFVGFCELTEVAPHPVTTPLVPSPGLDPEAGRLSFATAGRASDTCAKNKN